MRREPSEIPTAIALHAAQALRARPRHSEGYALQFLVADRASYAVAAGLIERVIALRGDETRQQEKSSRTRRP